MGPTSSNVQWAQCLQRVRKCDEGEAGLGPHHSRHASEGARHPLDLDMVCRRGEQPPSITFFSEFMPHPPHIQRSTILQSIAPRLEPFDIFKLVI